MIAIKLAIVIVTTLLLGLGLSWTSSTQAFIVRIHAANEPISTQPLQDLEDVQKRIVVRTLEGEPVPGIEVQLTPAGPELGGPPAAMLGQSATTDAQGSVLFSGLGEWVWMVSFRGTFRGSAIQPKAEQSLSPYGRTRNGGGFPILVQRQEEDEAAAPLVENGISLPEVQQSNFVLIPLQEGSHQQWAPTIDLALLSERPQPLTALAAPAALPNEETPTTPGLIQALASTNTNQPATPGTSVNTGTLVRWLYILPLAVAVVAILRALQQRIQERVQQRNSEQEQVHREESRV